MNSISCSSSIRGALLAALVSLTTGCYLFDSARGQLTVMSERKSIAHVIGSPNTAPSLRARLVEVTSIRDFASRELGLPDNGSYRSYADVGRAYVVWNVVAAPEFSIDAKKWCYPVVGCVAYRGYFAEAKARRFAAGLRAAGFDVAVGGVAAYSTLGHFHDPILNTMLGWDDVDLAAIVFHELTHQLVYVAGDAAFNEALATTVEEEGVRRWLLAQGRDADLDAHLAQEQQYLAIIALLRQCRDRLHDVYASGLSNGAMREQKRLILNDLHRNYAATTRDWQAPPFKAWFDGAINNADLASIATYYDCVPGFRRELQASGGDLVVFYARVQRLANMKQPIRDAAVCGNG